MKRTWLMLLLVLVLVLSGCQSGPVVQPVRLLEKPRPVLPALPAHLAQKKEPTSCRRLLLSLSASERLLHETCGISMTSSTSTTP